MRELSTENSKFVRSIRITRDTTVFVRYVNKSKLICGNNDYTYGTMSRHSNIIDYCTADTSELSMILPRGGPPRGVLYNYLIEDDCEFKMSEHFRYCDQ